MAGKIAMARSYAHKSSGMVRHDDGPEYEEVAVFRATDHPTLGRCLVGNFITGFGFINVHFPIDAIRPANEGERITLLNRRYGGCTGPFQIVEDELATQADLDSLPEVTSATL
jgi:hypothetical protein